MVEEFATEDMALAAYLRCRGYKHDHLAGAGQAEWVYLDTDALQDEVSGYYEGNATVEPERFTRTLGLVRRELYDHLGVAKKRLSPSS